MGIPPAGPGQLWQGAIHYSGFWVPIPDAMVRLADFLWGSFLLLSPMLLLGLFLAGVIHILISRETVLAWLSGNSMKAVCASAAVGVPVPLCSCSVVPVVAEMRNKGASRASCMSFLITAPETGADSVLVTHAFFGFVAAVVRPVVSFLTAVAAGLFCIGLLPERDSGTNKVQSDGHDQEGCGPDHGGHAHDHGDCCHDRDEHASLYGNGVDCYVSLSRLRELLMDSLAALSSRLLPSAARPRSSQLAPTSASALASGSAGHGTSAPPPRVVKSSHAAHDHSGDPDGDGLTLRKVCGHVFRYGFVEVADDILFALLVGIALGGVLFLAVPDGLVASDQARWLSYPIMVIVGVPIYICASASTPIAAALVVKGVSPGAALIFLMTGPATNSGTIAITVSRFGKRFATIYVTVVIAVTVVIGILLDLVLIATGLTLPVNLSPPESTALQLVEWVGALGLIALMAWRFRSGALKSGYQDLVASLRPISFRGNKG